MKRILFLALLVFSFSLLTPAQSRTNRLYRPCPGSTTPATVAIAVDGSITATPCSGKAGIPNTLVSYLTSTVTYNNNGVLADTALSVNVVASGIYDIDAMLHSTSVPATGLLVDFGGTATVTNFIGEWEAYIATGDETDPLNRQRVTAAGTDFIATGIAAGDSFFRFRGSIEVNAAGTFLVRGAQQGAAVGNTSILRGSVLKLTKLN